MGLFSNLHLPSSTQRKHPDRSQKFISSLNNNHLGAIPLCIFVGQHNIPLAWFCLLSWLGWVPGKRFPNYTRLLAHTPSFCTHEPRQDVLWLQSSPQLPRAHVLSHRHHRHAFFFSSTYTCSRLRCSRQAISSWEVTKPGRCDAPQGKNYHQAFFDVGGTDWRPSHGGGTNSEPSEESSSSKLNREWVCNGTTHWAGGLGQIIFSFLYERANEGLGD